MRDTVSLSDLDDVIIKEDFSCRPSIGITICILTLRNGTTVTGISNLPFDYLMQDSELGVTLARDDARRKVFELESYVLRQEIWMMSQDKKNDNTDVWKIKSSKDDAVKETVEIKAEDFVKAIEGDGIITLPSGKRIQLLYPVNIPGLVVNEPSVMLDINIEYKPLTDET